MKTLILTLTLLPYLLFAQTRIIPFSSNPGAGSAPAAVTDLAAVDHTNLELTINFTESASTDYYLIFADSSDIDAVTQRDSIASGVSTYTLAGLTNEAFWTVRVKSGNASGVSDYSLQDTATVDSAQIIPIASSEFSTDGISYWTVERCTTAWNASGWIELYVTNDAGKTAIEENMLIAGLKYYLSFDIKSGNAVGDWRMFQSSWDVGTGVLGTVTSGWNTFSGTLEDGTDAWLFLQSYDNLTIDWQIDIDNIKASRTP